MPVLDDSLTVALHGSSADLRLAGFSGKEGISELFEFTLEMFSESDILPADAVGKDILFTVYPEAEAPRFFHGIVSRWCYKGRSGRKAIGYRAVVVPKLWLLTYRADCRIFQDVTAPVIIKKVLDGAGLVENTDYRLAVRGTYVSREFCVQYRETDFEFISRLMEDEGIFYYFEHSDSGHVLVLIDHKAYPSIAGTATVEYIPGKGYRRESIAAFEFQEQIRTGKWTARDYDFKKPALALECQREGSKDTALEQYDYPGNYELPADGKSQAVIRLEEQETPRKVAGGAGNRFNFIAGATFTLEHYAIESVNIKYLLTSVQHSAGGDDVDSACLAGNYTNTFICIPADRQFRPPRLTPRRTVKGPQTAIVTGPSGEEIYTDKYGRVKVQFHWDRLGRKDDKTSCWIRVSQVWAGEAWGGMFIPRINQEVIVDFLEGNPDRPLITGRVYHGTNVVPYSLPDEKTKSTIKSNTTPGGGGSNELRFEDKKGSEEVFFHAQKDFNRVVENNDTLIVGSNDNNKCTDGTQTIEIWKDRSTTIHTGDETIVIEKGKRTETVKKGDETVTITEGNRQVTVSKGTDTHQVKSDRTVIIDEGNDLHHIKTGDRAVKIDTGNDALTVTTGNHAVKIAAGKSETTAAQSISLGVSPASVKLEPSAITLSIGPSSIKLEPAAITLALGPSTIKLEMAGITISGLKLSAEGKLQVEVKGGLSAAFGNAALTKVAGGAIMIG